MLTNGSPVDQTAGQVGTGAEAGIVSDAADTARFLTGLMQGRLLSSAMLDSM